MYLPKHFEETDPAVLHALIRAHSLGTWVALHAGELVVNHIPVMLDADRGPHGTLVAHVARANPLWQVFQAAAADAPPVAVVFQGPQAYITPSWYPAKREHGKVVPTWNYAVVHAHGRPRVIDGRDELLALVTRLTNTHESRRAAPWQVSDAPIDYIDGMLRGIVGLEMPIERLVGKWKLSQNHPAPTQAGVVSGLHGEGLEASTALAALMRANPKP